MNTFINGTNRILFSNGKLFLNNIQIAGEGIVPQKDILFEFNINKPENIINISPDPEESPPILEISVFDAIKGKSVGPGQIG